ncbi:MAG: TetR/AcrR family transcriptional regulator, partial [Peptococcaceae bacterium]|nr:TetR/AcrR family transcriptional regulator [Peptococcaceae bacterium]
MGKQTEKTLQTKTDLIEAFWQLYKEMPINKITVKDITNRAGYYRSTFYNYFDDVYAVLNDIEASVLQDWEDILSTAFHEKYKVLIYKDIQIIINLIIPFYEKNGEYIAVLLSPNGDPTFQKKIKSTLRQKLFVLLE